MQHTTRVHGPGPSTLIGLATITDTTAPDVTDTVLEFHGCFDPLSTQRRRN